MVARLPDSSIVRQRHAMNSEVWIGAVISIPIAIASGLAVEPIQRWWQRRGEHSHAKKFKQMEAEYNRVTFYAVHSDLMIADLVIKGIGITLYVAYLLFMTFIGPIVQELADFLPRSPHPSDTALIVLPAALLACLISLTVFVLTIAIRGVSLYNHVRHYKVYVTNFPAQIRDLELEEAVLIARQHRAFPTSYTRSTDHVDSGATPPTPER
jgi:hypothetical protein